MIPLLTHLFHVHRDIIPYLLEFSRCWRMFFEVIDRKQVAIVKTSASIDDQI
jgi:hypothetical protein